jgi:pimeloyl-ACP methyl ester carboxylesterase
VIAPATAYPVSPIATSRSTASASSTGRSARRRAPTLLLLYGFPSSSHQFRRLSSHRSAALHASRALAIVDLGLLIVFAPSSVPGLTPPMEDQKGETRD